MKRKNSTRSALILSIISMLLCVSMLVGTTFAWFTDEVVSGMNTIAAGNLDIELMADGKKVTTETKLFDDVALWEPGVVVYENLEIVNVGTLALKYQMSLNIGNENDLNGHKLSEVLKVAILKDTTIEQDADRQDVLKLAEDAVDLDTGLGILSNFYHVGELSAANAVAPTAPSSEKLAVVIFWAPNSAEVDNLYNANNGQTTSDGKPLHIEFGVNLQATQKMEENDTFGPDYDKFATILPQASVIDLGAQAVEATRNDWGGNTVASTYDLPFVLQFQPNETLDEANLSAYKYWHADYVVKTDRDVPANSMALLGYYKAFCDGFNNGNWVALSAEETVAAGTEIRLVDVMGGGDGSGNGGIKVTYKDICQWGNDGVGFLCSAADLTGENAGTTLTVELRMYANNSDPNDSSYNNGDETGVYYVIGTYTYTFGMGTQDTVTYVRTAEELQAALDSAVDGAVIAFANDITGNVTATQKAGVDVTVNGCGKTFNGVMTVFGDGRQSGEESLTIKDINFVAADGASSCIVSPDRSSQTPAKYSYAHNITIEGCTFTDPNATMKCAAIRTEDGGDKNWTIKACVVDNTMHSLTQVQNIEGKLTIAGCEVNSKNGINLNSTTNVEITDCVVNVLGYAVRIGVSSGGDPAAVKNMVLTNNTLTSAGDDGDAVIIIRASAANVTMTLNNTTLNGPTQIAGATADTTIITN